MRSLRTSTASGLIAVAVFLLAAALACLSPVSWAQAEPEPLRLSVNEPRAYGYQVGDIATREITVELPRRLRLDEDSLPVIGRHGPALDLRSLRREAHASATGTRLTLWLEYQVFAAPLAARVYELPAFRLRFEGRPRAEDLFVEAWPVAVAPLAPEQAAQRRGLGELQPDTPPAARDTRPERWVMTACAALALASGSWLGWVYLGLPWFSDRQRPFTRAYRRLRAGHKAPASPQAWRDACRAIHAAFNETAGQVVFADTVDAFVGRAPRFAPLREDIRAFFARSQTAFFGGDSPLVGGGASRPTVVAVSADAADVAERDWLLAFARACRNAERGTA